MWEQRSVTDVTLLGSVWDRRPLHSAVSILCYSSAETETLAYRHSCTAGSVRSAEGFAFHSSSSHPHAVKTGRKFPPLLPSQRRGTHERRATRRPSVAHWPFRWFSRFPFLLVFYKGAKILKKQLSESAWARGKRFSASIWRFYIKNISDTDFQPAKFQFGSCGGQNLNFKTCVKRMKAEKKKKRQAEEANSCLQMLSFNIAFCF